ncbi:hypothetical protein [Flavobacterium aquiphilum]|uniref:hypothetical protein n=1 Tax=Flavobacterium aquiphilum TaxID=3003261 RepID=UPI00247FEA19|nr:hypothetical protein [Flavobacterium aquiphilum]
MDVKILKIEGNTLVDAKIGNAKELKINLPSFTEGWRFNFNKHFKKKNFETYVLVSEETSERIEGCLSFEMRDKVEPYMAFVEVAPHNRGTVREYDNVAGCLIAYACRLSFLNGEDHFQGWLAFDVLEENIEDESKLMKVYATKYNALRFDESTTMFIPPEGGKKLINEFLDQEL